MAIVVRELARGREGDVTEDFQSSYTRVFVAETDDARVGPKLVKAALNLAIGQTYYTGYAGEVDTTAVLKRVRLSCDSDDGRTWQITAEYGPWTTQPLQDNPLNEPEEVEIGGDHYDRVCDRDINNNAVVNSAGDYFDPPVTRDDNRPTMTIVRNESYTSPDLSAEYSDTINSGLFFGQAAGNVKCGTITRRRQWHQACGFYWKTTYPFSLNRDGWQMKVLDQGLRQLVSGARKQITIDGQLATSPVLLDGSGAPMATGGTPTFRPFDVYPAKDFSVFGFAGA